MANVTGFTGIAWLASNPWAYPALESLHIVGIALLLGNLVALELRVWGLVAELPLRALARLSGSLSLAGFVLVALTGSLMFASQPAELLANRAFKLKLVLILSLIHIWMSSRTPSPTRSVTRWA